MREYFRQERLTFRYMPVFYLTRLLFVALIFLLPAVQMFVMIIAATFSYGFRYDSEEEWLIPQTDEDMRKKKLTRCKMIWLRYFLIGLLGILLAYLFPQYFKMRSSLFETPWILGAYFLLQMMVVYEALLERAVEFNRFNKPPKLFRFVCNSIPTIFFFSYGFAGMDTNHKLGFFFEGPQWLHVIVLLVNGALLGFYCRKLFRVWRLTGFSPSKAEDQMKTS